MREIKFRLYDKVNNFMVYPSKKIYINMFGKIVLESMDDGEIIEANENDYELMQYTGLKDKNGTRIYEGDIIQLVNEDNETVKAVCKFGNRRLTTIYGSTIDVQCYYFQIGDRKTNNYIWFHYRCSVLLFPNRG